MNFELPTLIYFYSSSFIVFFVFCFAVYWVLPSRLQNLFLLLISYIFYASWDWRFLTIIWVSTIVDFYCARQMEITKKNRKLYLSISLIVNLSLLAFFKYFNFFIDNAILALEAFNIQHDITVINIILPLGISFYTFQTMSYTIDVYRKKIKPVSSLVDFSLYVSYFPQLIAGPIEKSTKLLPQICHHRLFQDIDFKQSTYLFLFGVFKKVVVSDYIATFVDDCFSASVLDAPLIVLGGFLFLIQVYCDFSGYSNMARGISGFFCIKLTENFNLPLFAKNPSDFWNRWHITLSDWVKSYLFVPILFKFKSPYIAAAISMPLMGFWHGARWSFIIWGGYWLLLTIFYQSIKNFFISGCPTYIKKWSLRGVLSVIVMIFLSSLSFVIFRAESLSELHKYFFTANFTNIHWPKFFDLVHASLPLVLFLLTYECILNLLGDQLYLAKQNVYIQSFFYVVLFFVYRSYSGVAEREFIYFQF